MSETIHAEGLRKHYPPDVQALDGVSVAAEAGTVLALLGPNGAGKSTTVRVLTTLTRPDEGTARVAGHDVLAEPESVRRAIGVVAQKPGFDPAATGRENLELQGAIYDLPGSELGARVAALLERFDLTAAADRPARTYSGGMGRRLDIAMGLINRPQVLFLDEPTTGLDPEARTDMWREISRLGIPYKSPWSCRFSRPVASGSTPCFWPTTPIACRTRSGSRSTSWPATTARPSSGRVSVVSTFTVVDLPAPFGPRSPNTVPASTEKPTPSSARTPFGYVFTRSTASIAEPISTSYTCLDRKLS